MKQFFTSTLLVFICSIAVAQELYINAEPASTLPKGVIGVRLMGESYSGGLYRRNWLGLRFMYGITPKWSAYLTLNESNHHPDTLPRSYYALDNSRAGPHTHPFIKGGFPYIFGGATLYNKYRFLALDGNETHFRMAAYDELTLSHVAHDEAEPDLLGDNAGIENGVIATWLYKKLAVSLSGGILIPFNYKESVTLDHVIETDASTGKDYFVNNVTEDRQFRSGNAATYSLSIGYEVWPFHYKNYKQPVVNLYVEFIGESYDSATLKLKSPSVAAIANSYRQEVVSGYGGTPALEAGHTIDFRPGIQLILNSNTRIEFSPSILINGHDYTIPFYNPFGGVVYYANLQTYIFPGALKHHHKKPKADS